MHPKRFNATAVAIGLAVFALGSNAGAATSTAATPANAPASSAGTARSATAGKSVPAHDRRFAMKAAEAGMGEVELGKLAEQKAENEQVKQFGARMVRDHSQANDRLKQIAGSKDLTLPTKLDKSAQKDLDELGKLSGGKFDHAYIKKQVSGHEKVIKEFKKEAQSGKDPELRSFASSTLPTLEEHLKLAKSAQQAVEGEASKNASSKSGIKAAKKATGGTLAHTEKQDRMPVAKTGM